MPWKPGRVHQIGVVLTSVVALVLLLTVFNALYRLLFPPPYRGIPGLRLEVGYYLVVALVPILIWFIPALLRWLTHTTYAVHRLLVGRSGFYVRFPAPRKLRFRDTVVMSFGPFAVDLLIIVQVEYYFAASDLSALARGMVLVPGLVLLAGLVTALVPGTWLVDAMDIRLVNPKRGEVVRAAALFEGILGPVGAIALLVSFITTLRETNSSYEQAAYTLATWAVRLFPPVLAAISVFRVFAEPRVLPALERWSEAQGIHVKQDLADDLESMRAGPPPEEPVDEAGPHEHRV